MASWQKAKGKFHYLPYDDGIVEEGRFLSAGCSVLMQVSRRSQVIYPEMSNRCEECVDVWRLIATSVDDAKITLKSETRLIVLEQAAKFTKSITLRKAIEARIRKLEKAGAK